MAQEKTQKFPPKKIVEEDDESDYEEEFDEEADDAEQERLENDILNDSNIVAKYKEAAEVVNKALAAVIQAVKAGEKVQVLSQLGDDTITQLVSTLYQSKKEDEKVEKGVAFPTSISVNHVVGHYSPLDDTVVLAEGDVVKIDLGAHIDGYVATAGHTTVVGATAAAPVSGRKADVLAAAHFAAEAALRLLKPGKTNTDVTNTIQQVAEAFKCTPVQGVLSHQMKRYVLDGNRTIVNRNAPEHKVDETTFVEGDVWHVDVVISTGDGKTREGDLRTTIYKRAVDQRYLLKLRASRNLLNDVTNRYQTFPFTLRAIDSKLRLGLKELVEHQLVHPYPVLIERQGEFVAQIKFTAVILNDRTDRITLAQPLPSAQSQYKIEDKALLTLLAQGTKRLTAAQKAKKKKNKKKPAAAPAATAAN